ncbi:hypothetical protein [Clostridium estertheticum]|uniref:hypothetical protein n=1 Tax=Clostridium estertheticum TaxID=238834 RepID=UPI0022DD9BE3|nr:hypothetical protein [Clostridium estertheticum]WBL49433.1 hypothetical protein LOR37_22775 [Clostridium estertheticum]WLC82135.1 hypothetical protein KTC98_23335 [Clostridium estertheticum]WLC91132.1 hypothetical protein KTC95_22540 [Clostridium estertheticum]
MVQILINYKINKGTYSNIRNSIKMARTKTSWRKKLETVPEQKRIIYEQSKSILTRSALRDLLFNNIK